MNGYKLKRLRIEKGYSLSRLSNLTGISKSYLSLIEREIQTNPSIEILEKLANTFEVSVEVLVKSEKEIGISNIGKIQVKSTLRFEIELSEEQLNPQKLKQIKDLINAIKKE